MKSPKTMINLLSIWYQFCVFLNYFFDYNTNSALVVYDYHATYWTNQTIPKYRVSRDHRILVLADFINAI